jgi:diguanylate cyclase (GGDEF)-like protein
VSGRAGDPPSGEFDGRERRATPVQGTTAIPPPVEPALAHRHARQLALLRAVSTRLDHTATSGEVAELLLDTLAAAYAAPWVALYRANPDGSFSRRAVRPSEQLPREEEPWAAPEEVVGPVVTRLHYAPDAPVLSASSVGDPDPARLLGAAMAVPVDDQGSRLGWLAVGPRDGAYDEVDLRFLALVAHFSAPRIAYADLAAAYRHASLIDATTGLGNRRAFEDRFEEELSRSNRTGQPMALMLCELDRFTALAGRDGVDGDRILRAAAAAVSHSVRRSDTVFRHADARIAVIITNTDASGARIAGERLRTGVAALVPPDVPAPLTCSVGIAALKGVHKPLSLATLALYNKADEALHRAIREGGNRCVVR